MTKDRRLIRGFLKIIQDVHEKCWGSDDQQLDFGSMPPKHTKYIQIPKNLQYHSVPILVRNVKDSTVPCTERTSLDMDGIGDVLSASIRISCKHCLQKCTSPTGKELTVESTGNDPPIKVLSTSINS